MRLHEVILHLERRRCAIEQVKELRCVMEHRLWLDYYNKTLLEKGVITQHDYEKMAQAIRKKYPTTKRTA